MKQKTKILPEESSAMGRLVVFLFPSWDFLFQPYHPSGPTSPTKAEFNPQDLPFFPTATWNYRKRNVIISSQAMRSIWYLNWKTNHGDENHPALTQYFLCIGFHVIRSSFLTPWHFCLKIALSQGPQHIHQTVAMDPSSSFHQKMSPFNLNRKKSQFQNLHLVDLHPNLS